MPGDLNGLIPVAADLLYEHRIAGPHHSRQKGKHIPSRIQMKGLLPVEAEQNNTCYADHKSHKKSHLQFLIPQENKSQNGGAERCCRHDHPHI